MNLSELETALEELANHLNGELSLQIRPKMEAGIAFGNSHYFTSGVTDAKDIYWQLAYEAVKDCNIMIEKAHEIFNSNVSNDLDIHFPSLKNDLDNISIAT